MPTTISGANHTLDECIGCDTCAPPSTPTCDGCGDPTIDGSPCDDCTTCDRCDSVVLDSETTETVRGSTICEDCLDEYYWQCGECDGWNRDGSDCGNDCDQSDDDDDVLVHSYDYKPYPIFYGAGPLYLGLEIEVETPYNRDQACAQLVHDRLGDIGYLKNDSSIGNSGFEVVTHPMSYQWALDNCPWQFLDQLRAAGCAATRRTGLHVHVSRDAFVSPSHVYRWMKFIYRNQQQVITLARRKSPQWAAFTDDDRRAVVDYAKGTRGYARYRAINTGNEDTFELRIFASSLDPGEVKAALGFAAASVEYTRDLTFHEIARDGGWAWSSFVDWLAARPVYAPLTAQLEALACVC
ncbi:hypothetical protein [Plantactinospora sp. CA-290183]|uniref:hypothetical protein n=1 Tax=Plantactinospora sp. CA-290183 TaxID=3240006 RepID=UPI003D910598